MLNIYRGSCACFHYQKALSSSRCKSGKLIFQLRHTWPICDKDQGTRTLEWHKLSSIAFDNLALSSNWYSITDDRTHYITLSHEGICHCVTGTIRKTHISWQIVLLTKCLWPTLWKKRPKSVRWHASLTWLIWLFWMIWLTKLNQNNLPRYITPAKNNISWLQILWDITPKHKYLMIAYFMRYKTEPQYLFLSFSKIVRL